MRIRTRITLFFAAAMMALVIGGALFTRRVVSSAFSESNEATNAIIQEAARAALERQALLLLRYISSAAAAPAYQLDMAALRTLVEDGEKQAGVARIEILNRAGRILADGSEDVFLRNVVRLDPARRRAVDASEAGLRWYRDRMVAWSPIVLSGDRIGAVWAEFNLEEHQALLAKSDAASQQVLQSAIQHTREGSAAVAVGVIALALATAVGLAVTLTRPLQQLAAVVRRFGEGEMEVRAVHAGRDEVAEVATRFNQMADQVVSAQAQLKENTRLQSELEIASSIQTSILPPLRDQEGLRFAGMMYTAAEVGGDYYDVISHPEGCWIGIGDVSGHGLTAGLFMMMVQSGIASLARQPASPSPARVLAAVNSAIWDNIHHRLGTGDYMTALLVRHLGDGRFQFAGAHEEIILWRAATGSCQRITPRGSWLALAPDLAEAFVDQDLTLEKGDRMVLYTDGVVEVANAAGEQLGVSRLERAICKAAPSPEGPEAVLAAVREMLTEYGGRREDDQTLLVIQRQS